jgi:TetR/AcrR family transcriptional regulator, repressor for uid operon
MTVFAQPSALNALDASGIGGASSRAVRREAQVQRILDAARACFLKSGFNGASMGDICAEANMSPGALYRYFPSKESLVEAICAVDREEDARILMTVAAAPSIVDGLTEAVLLHVEHVHRSGMAALFSEIFAEAQRNEAIAGTVMRSMREARAMLEAGLRQAVEAGVIAPVAPLPVVLETMMSMGHGLVMADLPRQGLNREALEPVIRAMITAALRPTGKLISCAAMQSEMPQPA